MKPVKDLISKVIQIQAVAQHGNHNSGEHIQLFSLCEDGSVWVQYNSSGGANVPETGEWFPVVPPNGQIDEQECNAALKAWIVKEAEQHGTCTYNIFREICADCGCGKRA